MSRKRAPIGESSRSIGSPVVMYLARLLETGATGLVRDGVGFDAPMADLSYLDYTLLRSKPCDAIMSSCHVMETTEEGANEKKALALSLLGLK